MAEAKEKDPLFSPKNRKLLSEPLVLNNPITVQVLGICSALAITVKLEPSVVMAISVIAIMGIANLIISIIRKLIPPRIRIIVMLTVISSLVVLTDQILEAFLYDVSKQLSVFVGLIITNCIIMGRLEAFASNNKPWPSFLDGIGNAFGYAWILVVVGFFRELLGSGEIYGYPLMEKLGMYQIGYVDNGLMILPPAALFIVGIIIWVHRGKNEELVDIS